MSPGLENGTVVVSLLSGGADETRTRDPLLAKQVLYQLSYDPSGGIRERTDSEIYFVRSTETQATRYILL